MAKFKVGDKVRIKEGMDLAKIGILFAAPELRNKELVIGGRNGWDWEIDGWFIPERYIEKL